MDKDSRNIHSPVPPAAALKSSPPKLFGPPLSRTPSPNPTSPSVSASSSPSIAALARREAKTKAKAAEPAKSQQSGAKSEEQVKTTTEHRAIGSEGEQQSDESHKGENQSQEQKEAAKDDTKKEQDSDEQNSSDQDSNEQNSGDQDMASNASSGPGGRGYHQDYIARVRYNNGLPPPDMPPKLLPIPGEGVAAHYTSPSFASRLAREQPLNIEADAELGMPLDLVGMPGIFDGDESSIQAPDVAPAPHPHDKPLLRPLSSLGKPTSMTSGVSFLRRTEYISSESSRMRTEAKYSEKNIRATKEAQRKRELEADQNDPVDILRSIMHSFDVANPGNVYTGDDTSEQFRGHPVTETEKEAWANPKHPTRKDAKPVDFYPILPDLDAFPDSGGYIVINFTSTPLGRKDERMSIALLRPKAPQPPELMEQYQAAVTAKMKDPSGRDPPPPPFDYDLYVPQFNVPENDSFVAAVKKKLDIYDADHDDPDLYSHVNKETGERNFRYERVRTYETAGGSLPKTKYSEIALTLYDPPEGEVNPKKQKGAYYYPILQKVNLKPRRPANLAHAGMMGGQAKAVQEDADHKVDYLDIVARDPGKEELERRQAYRNEVDPPDSEDEAEPAEENGEQT